MERSTSQTKSELIRGAASLSLAALLVKILGVAYKIPLSHILGDDGMGYFNTAYTVYTFFFLLCTAGVPKAIAILISENSKSKNSSTGALLKTAKHTFIITGTALAVLFAFTAFPISGLIGNKRAAFAMITIAPAIPFIAGASVYRGSLNGYMRFGTVAISQFIEAALKLILGLAISAIGIHHNLPSEHIAAGAVSGITWGSIITYIYLAISSKKVIKVKNAGQSCKFNKSLLNKIFRISLPTTLSSGVMSLVNIIDLTLIMRGLEKAGYTDSLSTMLYGNYTTLAVPMFNFILSVVTSICVSALPILTEISISKSEKRFENSLVFASKLVAFFALPATILFAFLPYEILVILFDRGSVALGAALLAILSPSVTVIAVLMIINTALEAQGRYTIPLLSMGVGGIVKIISSSLLLSETNLAIWGAPIGTLVSYLVSISFSFIVYHRCCGRVFTIARSFALSTVCAAIAIIPTIALRDYLLSANKTPLWSLCLLGFYGIVYFIVSFLGGNLPIKERNVCQNRQ